MRIIHLISTMNRTGADFLSDMNCRFDSVIVNQSDFCGTDTFTLGTNEHKMLSTTERGLSSSRNMLLDNADGDIAIIGDDDIVYLEGYDEKIRAAYSTYEDADIIVFSFTESLTESTRRQYKRPKRIGIFGVSKIASVEISFKLESVRRAKLRFDTRLGLGAPFGSAEENAFLADAVRAGLKIIYLPMTLCYLLPDTDERVKWKNGFDEDYFIKKGGCFSRIYGRLFLPFAIGFLLTKRFTLFREAGFFRPLKWMLRGKKRLRELS